jgi:hypothetical protein
MTSSRLPAGVETLLMNLLPQKLVDFEDEDPEQAFLASLTNKQKRMLLEYATSLLALVLTTRSQKIF